MATPKVTFTLLVKTFLKLIMFFSTEKCVYLRSRFMEKMKLESVWHEFLNSVTRIVNEKMELIMELVLYMGWVQVQ